MTSISSWTEGALQRTANWIINLLTTFIISYFHKHRGNINCERTCIWYRTSSNSTDWQSRSNPFSEPLKSEDIKNWNDNKQTWNFNEIFWAFMLDLKSKTSDNRIWKYYLFIFKSRKTLERLPIQSNTNKHSTILQKNSAFTIYYYCKQAKHGDPRNFMKGERIARIRNPNVRN